MSRKRRRKAAPPEAHGQQEAAPTASDASTTVRRVFLLTAAFCAGAAVMVIELAGNRILAPWYGNSMYTWTGLIGVILISISGGYYLGGYLADRRGSDRTLGHLLAASAVLTLVIPTLQVACLNVLGGLNVLAGPVAATMVLFAVPGCLLAAVAPYAVRLVSLLSQDRHVGISAGSVGMAGTLGSVVGTFATGFVLVPHMPLRMIFMLTGGLLAVLAMVAYWLFWPRLRTDAGLAALLVLPFIGAALFGTLGVDETPTNVVHEQNTFYHRIRVVENPYDGLEGPDTRRTLLLDTTIEGGQLVRSREVPTDHAYQHHWGLTRLFLPTVDRGVFLGGGAFAMPQAVLDHFDGAEVDVVEIDPAVVEVGRKYFRVDDYAGRLHAVAADGRRFLRSTEHRYDFIFGDAYAGIKCIPPHLITREFFELVKSRLTDEGIFIMNIAATPTGRNSVVFQSAVKTLGEVFAHQYVFASDPGDLTAEQNLFLVAADRDLDIDELAAREYEPEDPDLHLVLSYVAPARYDLSQGYVFTDARNPVEYLVAKTLVQGN